MKVLVQFLVQDLNNIERCLPKLNKALEITLFHLPPESMTLLDMEERLLALLEHRYLPNTQ